MLILLFKKKYEKINNKNIKIYIKYIYTIFNYKIKIIIFLHIKKKLFYFLDNYIFNYNNFIILFNLL